MADNLNTTYLGQPPVGDNLNTGFLPPTASEATHQVRSDISTAGQLFSQGAANLGGTLAVAGVTTLSAALNSASAISGGAITGTTAIFTGTIDTDSAVSMAELTATGGNFSSVISSTDAGGDVLSVATAADDTGMPDGAMRFVNTASGISIAYRSGGTTYYYGHSTISEA